MAPPAPTASPAGEATGVRITTLTAAAPVAERTPVIDPAGKRGAFAVDCSGVLAQTTSGTHLVAHDDRLLAVDLPQKMQEVEGVGVVVVDDQRAHP